MRAILSALLVALMPAAAAAQQATLVADSVRLERDRLLIAEGEVQVAYEGQVLNATRVTYDRETERLDIAGPITLTDGPDTVVLADSAALDADLRNGILRSARLVLNRQLQLAATQIARVGDRYVQLSNTVASSCEICAGSGTPTWEIRARRVIHDRQERLIYFDRASFRVFGLPVAYFPRLTLPAPDRRRKAGFLIPRLAFNSRLSMGVKLPYFQPLGPHADLTLTPYVSSNTRTLEGRYRQTFAAGAINVNAAVSQDDLQPGQERWYLLARGGFLVPRDFRLEFDIQAASDDSYIFDYDYDFQDTLTSEVRLIRADRDTLLRARVTQYETLRAAEKRIEDELPSVVTDIVGERRIAMGAGEVRLGFDAAVIGRSSDEPGPGRDVVTVGAEAQYLDRRVLGPGLVWRNRARVASRFYRTEQDPDFATESARLTGAVSTQLSLPLARTGPGGTQHLVEPVVALTWADQSDAEIPNEDSVIVELDEGNLFSLGRFPGDDTVETGLRADLGLRYAGRFPGGTAVDLTLGRIVRAEASDDFATETGLAGRRSDWLAAARLQFGTRVDVTSRMLFDDNLEARSSQTRMTYRQGPFSVLGSYNWLAAEPQENRPDDIDEVKLSTTLRIGRHWVTGLSGRYDFGENESSEAALSLRYRTECLRAGAILRRKFTETATIRPATTFNFGVELVGFGADPTGGAFRRTCSG